MSLFGKMFGGGKSSKSKSKSSKQKEKDAKTDDYGFTPEEMAEAKKDLGVIVDRKDRLSVSKSGRHKIKGRKRLNVGDDTYAKSGDISQNPSANTHDKGHSTASSSQGARSSGQGSLGRNSQNGSLGRSQGHCAVAQQSSTAMRYSGGQKMPRQPTAV